MKITLAMNITTKFASVAFLFSMIYVAQMISAEEMASLPNQRIANKRDTNRDMASSLRSMATSGSMEKHRYLQDGGRIVGGSLAPSGKYLSFAGDLGGCGATLIHGDIVLTAAHCSSLFNRGDIIYIGGIKSDGSDAEQIAVASKVVHPNYKSARINNDLMIIKLSRSSTRPIQTLNFDSTNPRVNDPLITVGYGNLGSGISYSGNLRQVTVLSVDDNTCKTTYTKAGDFYSIDTMMCAGVSGGGKDSCQGDSGGPLYDSSLRQVGIVSHGNGCGLAAYPGVYTRISHYESWITQMICENSSNPPSNCSINPTPSSPISSTSSFSPTPSLSSFSPSPSFVSSQNQDVPTCFSGSNLVEVKHVGHILLSELRIGDYVRVGDDDYSQVYGFGHYDKDLESEFLQIYVEDQISEEQPLEITSDHLLFVRRGFHNNHVIPASEIVVGDVLRDGKKVKSIEHVIRRGVYSPLTQSGDIIVSGVHASSYVDILHDNKRWFLLDQHVLGHAYQYPRRLFCQYNIDMCMKETYTNGYSFGAYVIIQFASILKASGWFGSIIVSFWSIPLVSFIYIFERMTIVSFGSLVIVTAISILWWMSSSTENREKMKPTIFPTLSSLLLVSRRQSQTL